MARNTAQRLDRIERLIRERMQPDTSPLFLRDGQSIPDGIDQSRIVFIKRVLIDPPERDQEQLPEMAIEPEIEPELKKGFDRPLVSPNLGRM
jgi:hypothetical protein